MLTLNASPFIETVLLLERISTIAEQWRNLKPDNGLSDNLDDEAAVQTKKTLGEVIEHSQTLGTVVTQRQAKRVLNWLNEGHQYTYGELANLYGELRRRLRDELESTCLLVLDGDAQRFFAPASPLFGQEFADRFRTQGAYELDEAAKCRALGRPTACVFHLMRLLEIGIEALRLCLAIPDPVKPVERNWGIVLEKIQKDGINKKWPTAASKMAPDAVLFERLYASLDAIKNPWRNGTMHVENKYTDDEAEHIFIAVKGFMKALASRMDEEGKPFA